MLSGSKPHQQAWPRLLVLGSSDMTACPVVRAPVVHGDEVIAGMIRLGLRHKRIDIAGSMARTYPAAHKHAAQHSPPFVLRSKPRVASRA